MLAKHILGYLPSLVIPAITAFVAIYCYTHILSPAEFGYYALSLNAMTLITAIFYYWLQTSLPRLLPQAMRDGKEKHFQTTSYIAFLVISVVLAVVAMLYAYFAPTGQMYYVIIFAVPLAIARALLNINQSFHRTHLRIGRYNLIECGQAVLGLLVGLLLTMCFALNSSGAVLGMLMGMLCMTLVDIRGICRLKITNYQPTILKEIAQFGLPMVVTYGIATFLSVSDRFLVEHFCGAAQLGIYAAGYTLMDRIITMIFMMIATPSFPLTVNKLEHEGMEAAQRQTYHNGVAILSIALPACAGLLLSGEHLANLLIGPQFREGAIHVMPWIATSSILGGLATHYFDHAFYLAKKPRMLLFTQGPAAVVNLLLNLVLIPRYGFMGAAYANVAAYVILLLLSVLVGRRVFAIQFPFIPALQLAFATGMMALVLTLCAFPVSFMGLCMLVATGGVVYGVSVWTLNVEGVRAKAYKLLRRKI